MLKSQEIQLAQSKRRERMAEIQKADTVSDEGRTELRSLSAAYEGGEIELRAAMLVEGAQRDQMQAPENDKAGADFERECRAFSVSNVVAAIEGNRALEGREAEVVKELETRSGGPQRGGILLPWQALETRADAFTTTADPEAGNMATRPTMAALERFFETSAAAQFGITSVQVQGRPRWPSIVDGASATWLGEGEGVDAEPIQTVTKEAAIHTAGARYLLSRQSLRENPGLETILRRDLSNVLREAVDRAVFQGSGVGPEPAGLAVQLAGLSAYDLDAKADFSPLLAYAVRLMEDSKLSNLKELRLAMAPSAFGTLVDDLYPGTGISPFDRLRSTFREPVVSSQVSPTAARDATGKGASTMFMQAGTGNGYVVNWGQPELIVDPYSESKSGKVAMTVFTFVDLIFHRLATHWLALGGVQDRA